MHTCMPANNMPQIFNNLSGSEIHFNLESFVMYNEYLKSIVSKIENPICIKKMKSVTKVWKKYQIPIKKAEKNNPKYIQVDQRH